MAHGVEWGNAQDSLGSLRIQAGPQGRQSGMIECILPEALSPAEFYGLIRGEDGKAVPTQLSSKSPKRLFWCLEKPLAANAFRFAFTAFASTLKAFGRFKLPIAYATYLVVVSLRVSLYE